MTNAISYSAIRTRYYGPTDTKGERIIAYRTGNPFSCGSCRPAHIFSHSLEMAYNYAISNTENHHAAAVLHLAKFNLENDTAKIRPEGLSWGYGDMFWTWSCE